MVSVETGSDQDAEATEVAGPRDWAPRIAGALWFTAIVIVALLLWFTEAPVTKTIEKVVGWTIAGWFVYALVLGTPSSRLPPEARLRRDRRRVGALVGALAGLVLVGGFVESFYLRTWSDWVFFGVMVMMGLGILLMLNVHFGIG